MKKAGILMTLAVAVVLASAAAPKANAQVAIGVTIGAPVYVHPVRPYYVVPRPYVAYVPAPVYPRVYVAPAPVYYRHWYRRHYVGRPYYGNRPYYRHWR